MSPDSSKLEVSMAFLFRDISKGHRTDGQRDGVKYSKEDRTSDHVHGVNERYVRYATDKQTNIPKTTFSLVVEDTCRLHVQLAAAYFDFSLT